MKSLPLNRTEQGDQVTVECADGEVSVYTRCAYCIHCEGVRVGRRVMPAPLKQALQDLKRGTAQDESVFSAAMMFNTLIRDGSAIECNDDANEGFRSLYASRRLR
ncbi:MAG: hypothetical protein QMD46_00080 [Methanomicrobiales archaeon]|nr:hypothetical protein [Methanomicrobiales archaeon]MDI6875822.1 hypothetical protein [Methanomicrobiales archaeon]